MISPSSKHVLMSVRVILERKLAENRWEKYKWSVIDVLPGSFSNNSSLKAVKNNGNYKSTLNKQLFTVESEIDLHRAEVEAYLENLTSSEPAIYVVLRLDGPDDKPSEYGINLDMVSLSPYIIQDYEDIGEDQIEKVKLAGPISSFIQDFVNEHFKPVKFIKRQRDKLSVDANEDGKGDLRVKQISDVFRSPRKKNKH